MYVKLFNRILGSSISKDRKLRHFFTDMLLCADAGGNVILTQGAIARMIGASPEEVEWGITELMKPDPESLSQDHDGKRLIPLEGHGYGWHIVNYAHYRGVKDAEQLREATRARVAKHREKTRNASVTLPVTMKRQEEAEAKEEAEKKPPTGGGGGAKASRKEPAVPEDPRFDSFWNAYPRRVGKKAARVAWEKLNNSERTVAAAAAGVYAKVWGAATQERRRFIPHPSTWLNGERFRDDVNAWKDEAQVQVSVRPIYSPEELAAAGVAREAAIRRDAEAAARRERDAGRSGGFRPLYDAVAPPPDENEEDFE